MSDDIAKSQYGKSYSQLSSVQKQQVDATSSALKQREAIKSKSTSTSSKSTSTSQTSNKDSVSSSFYGKSYSQLSSVQKQQVDASLQAGEQRLKVTGKSVTPESVLKEVRSDMTKEAREKTPQQVREEQAQTQIKAQQLKDNIQRQKLQSQVQSQKVQTQTAYSTPPPNRIEAIKERVKSPLELKREAETSIQQSFINAQRDKQNPLIRYDLQGRPYEVKREEVPQYFGQKENYMTSPLGKYGIWGDVVRNEKGEVIGREVIKTYSPPPYNFSDVVGYKKAIERLKAGDDNIKVSLKNALPSEPIVPSLTQRDRENIAKWENVKITKSNIDAFRRDVPLSTQRLAEQEITLSKGTSLEYSENLKLSNPDLYEKQTSTLNLSSNVQDFRTKTSTKIIGTTGGVALAFGVTGGTSLAVPLLKVAGGLTLASGLEYGVGKVSKNDLTLTQSLALKGTTLAITSLSPSSLVSKGVLTAYGLSVAYRGTKVISGLGYEDTPIKRQIEGAELTSELVGLGLGYSIVASKTPSIKGYERKSSELIRQNEKDLILTERGTIPSKLGTSKFDVKTDILFNKGGTAIYRTQYFQGKQLIKTTYGDIPQFEARFYSDSGLRDLGQLQVYVKPQQLTQQFTQVPFKPQGYPYKATLDATFISQTGKVAVTTQKLDIQPLANQQAQVQTQSQTQIYKDLSSPSYKYTQLKTTGAEIQRYTLITTPKGEVILTDVPFSQIQSQTIKNYGLNQKLFSSKSASLGIPSQQASVYPITQNVNIPSNAFIESTSFGGIITTTLPSNVIPVPLGLNNSLIESTQENVFDIQPLPLSRERTIVKSVSSTRNITRTEAITEPISSTTTKLDISQTTTQENVTPPPPPIIYPPTIINPIIPPPPPPMFFKADNTKAKGFGLGRGYDVYVRRYGKFRKVNLGGSLKRTDALDFGTSIVTTTASATFKIVKSQNPLMKRELSTRKKGAFRRFSSILTRKGTSMFTEKRGKRIKTLGEKAQITYKGKRNLFGF